MAADRQYPPLAEPLTLPPANDPPQPHLPWLEAVPLPKGRLTPEAFAMPVVALPYDLPLLDPSPVVMRRVEMRREGFAQPVAPLPFDLPLLDPSPEVVRRIEPRREGYASPVAPMPYDLPLTAPPELVRARARTLGEGTPEWGRADAVVVPDLSQAFGDVPVRRKIDLRHTQSTEWGRADGAVPDVSHIGLDLPVRRRFVSPDTATPFVPTVLPAPTFALGFGEIPVRRRPDLRHTQSPEIGRSSDAPDYIPVPPPDVVRAKLRSEHTQTPEWGRADPPPPPAPDLSALVQPDPLPRPRLRWAPDAAQVVLPPGYPPDWYPSPEPFVRRRRFLTPEAYARPSDRPFVPFDPATNPATDPLPPQRPAAHSYATALSSIPPPAGPPSSALTPPGVVSWEPQPNQPPRGPQPRQPLDSAPQNVDPIPQAAPPEGSWYPSAEVPPVRLTARPWLEAFAQNIDPIDTPAYLASFWLSYYPSGPFPKQGLLAALQQALADAPPVVEVTVIVGAWRGEFPALLRAKPQLVPEAFARPQDMTTLADAYGCMTLSQVSATSPQLVVASVSGPTLLDVTVKSATLLAVEVC